MHRKIILTVVTGSRFLGKRYQKFAFYAFIMFSFKRFDDFLQGTMTSCKQTLIPTTNNFWQRRFSNEKFTRFSILDLIWKILWNHFVYIFFSCIFQCGYTALHWAAIYGKPEIAHALLNDSTCRIDTKDNVSGIMILLFQMNDQKGIIHF